jgi:hypothetical protein
VTPRQKAGTVPPNRESRLPAVACCLTAPAWAALSKTATPTVTAVVPVA